jgi:hypothetical protein
VQLGKVPASAVPPFILSALNPNPHCFSDY